MKKKLIALFMAVCLLATILPMSALAVDTGMTVINKTDSIKGNSSYKVLSYSDDTEKTYDYSVPSGGATVLIFFSATCPNSAAVIKSFAESDLISNSSINILAYESNEQSKEAVTNFVNTNIVSEAAKNKIHVYYSGSCKSLIGAYLRLAYDSGSGTYPLVLIVDSNNSIRYSSMSKNDITIYKNALSNIVSDISGVDTVSVKVYGKAYYEYVDDILTSVNKARAEKSLSTLTLSYTLTEAAMQRAAELAIYYDHNRPNGTSCFTSVSGYTKVKSENIAMGYGTPAGVMNGWLNSPGHYNNIMNADNTQIGVGCFESAGKYYWVQLFGTGSESASVSTTSINKEVNISSLITYIDYTLSPSTTSVSIAKGKTVTFKMSNSYSSSAATLVPTVSVNGDAVDCKINEDKSVTFTGLKAGSATATLRAYDGDAGKTINITVSDSTKTPVTITGVSAATGLVYNGSAQKGYAGTPTSSNYSGSYTVKYEGTNGTSYSSSTAPTNAGSYRVTISVPESDETYTGSISLDFTIGKASITIKADDKQAAIGAAQPSYTYTVTGLAANDTLNTKPTLSCTPDMSKAGTYDIVPSGAVVPDGGNYNSTITYVKGKLTVSDKLTALLKSLSWSAGTMNKGFDPNTTEYVLNLSYWTDSVKLTARADSGLEIKSTGLSYSGYVYPSAGENLTVTFTVSGEGMTETKYTIVVKRAAKPEVYLEDMDISVGKLTPDFNKAETSYKLLLPINEKTVWFDLTASLGASISASGYDETDGGKFAVSVDPGKSQTIRFTVSKGTEAITYVVTVERKEGERITIKDSRNGKITVSDINAEYGDSVYIYVKPETGFALGELSITDSEGVSVKPVKVSENKYLFTMPKENVTIEAIFKIDLRMLPFGDVSLGSWYYDAIFYVYTNGLMEGVDSSSFNPDGTMTRAMIWAVLARIDGVSYITGSNWQTYARSWAMNNDISDGTNPNDPVTREQLVTMLWRFVGEPYSYGGLTGWSDASSVSDWAREAMSWAINDGIITGITSSTIGAKSTATRAQCATILMRFFEAID